MAQGAPPAVIPTVFKQAFFDLAPKWPFWFALLLPYVVFLWLQSVWRGCRRRAPGAVARALLLRLALPIALLVGTYKAGRLHAASERFDYAWDDSVHNTTGHSADRYSRDGRHRGAHVFGGAMTEAAIEPLLENNIEWIVLVPFGWQDAYDDPSVRFTALEGIEWADKDKFYIDQIEVARTRGIRTFVKPHLWLTGGGKWRSEISMGSDDHWQQWFTKYQSFILHYARLSQLHDVDAFCIGTELHQTVRQRPLDWIRLIAEVRRAYSGPITYAANWNDPMDEIPFWSDLDYIGLQAYFPLTTHRGPTIDELTRSWNDHVQALEILARQYAKPVLFTELGYKSVPDAAIEPWEWMRWPKSLFCKVSTQTQYNCYEAFFRSLWEKDWFAGVHIWQWGLDHEDAGGTSNPFFTPQNKPAQNCIAKWFAREVP